MRVKLFRISTLYSSNNEYSDLTKHLVDCSTPWQEISKEDLALLIKAVQIHNYNHSYDPDICTYRSLLIVEEITESPEEIISIDALLETERKRLQEEEKQKEALRKRQEANKKKKLGTEIEKKRAMLEKLKKELGE